MSMFSDISTGHDRTPCECDHADVMHKLTKIDTFVCSDSYTQLQPSCRCRRTQITCRKTLLIVLEPSACEVLHKQP